MRQRPESLYYLGRLKDNKFFCLTKERQWKLQSECEENNWQDVLVLPSKEAWELCHEMQGYNQYSGIYVYNNSSNRNLYIQINWHDREDICRPIKKIIAEGHFDACKQLGVSREDEHSIIHYSDVERYEIKEMVDEMPLSKIA